MKVTLEQLIDIEYGSQIQILSKPDSIKGDTQVSFVWYPGRVMEYVVKYGQKIVNEFDESQAQKALDLYNSF